MRFYIITTLLVAGLAAGAPVSDTAGVAAKASVEKRVFGSPLVCQALCVGLINNPPAYSACVSACEATGGEGFDPAKIENGIANFD